MVPTKPHIIELNFLSKTINDISKAKDFQSISEIIFDFIQELIHFNMAVIYRLNQKQGELEIVSCRGSDTKKMKKRVPFKIGEGAVGWVAKEKKALLLNDALDAEGVKVRQFFDEDPIIRSFLAVPLIVGDNLIGILSVSSSQPNQYRETHVEIITIIASQVAALMELNNEINETKRFSNHILENINSGVIVIDNNYKIIVFNKAAEKISGFKCEEVMGKSILDIPLKKDKGDWYIVESFKNEKIFFESPGYMIRKDGFSVKIRLSTSILYDDENNKKGCICIFRDNTEVEKLQQQVIRADKLAAIGRLTTGLTHEIRNPLLPIRTATQLLLSKISKKQEENEELIKLLEIINDESERLNRFLDQFVGLAKEGVDIREKTCLIEAIEETLILMRHGLNKNNIIVKKEYEIDSIYIYCSKDRLKQIFLNLLINSIDAIRSLKNHDLKLIHIKVTRNDDKAIIEFSDTGCGIEYDDINNIFDPFYTTKENGTGLGLPIIHNIITNTGGKILVDSEVGKGTKFTIIMPLYRHDKEV